MGNYTDINQWIDHVYEYDVTDPVTGGPTGIANKPLHDLSDRTAWLKDQLGRFANEAMLVGGQVIDKTFVNNAVTINIAGIQNFVLDDLNNFRTGDAILFNSFVGLNGVANILAAAGNSFFGQPNATTMNMHNFESMMIVAFKPFWRVVPIMGNFYCAGEEIKSRKILNNTLPLRGQLVSRDAYPRLFAYYQSLTDNQERVSEALWQSTADYRGLFSDGDGVSTFRLPDERGMFERMLDLGRGIDINRTHNFAGGYEADQNKAHTHSIATTNTGASTNSNADPIRGSIPGSPSARGAEDGGTIGSEGGNEAIVKNLAKLNLIKY